MPDTSAIELLKSSTPIADIVARTGMSVGEIAALAETNSLDPKHSKEALERLLNALVWGESHSAKKVQNRALRARTALAELAQMHVSEARVASAKADVDELEQKLAAARSRLKAAMHTPSTSTAAAAPAAGGPAPTKAERQQIRVWARRNGLPVADRGVIAQHIVDAYHRATATHRTGGAR